MFVLGGNRTQYIQHLIYLFITKQAVFIKINKNTSTFWYFRRSEKTFPCQTNHPQRVSKCSHKMSYHTLTGSPRVVHIPTNSLFWYFCSKFFRLMKICSRNVGCFSLLLYISAKISFLKHTFLLWFLRRLRLHVFDKQTTFY